MARIALVGVRSRRRRAFRVFAGSAPFDLDVPFRAQTKLPSCRRFRSRKGEKQNQDCAKREPGSGILLELSSQRPCRMSRAELARPRPGMDWAAAAKIGGRRPTAASDRPAALQSAEKLC